MARAKTQSRKMIQKQSPCALAALARDDFSDVSNIENMNNQAYGKDFSHQNNEGI